jgi:hypothetical protein
MKHIRVRTTTVTIAVAFTVLCTTWMARAAQKTTEGDVTGKWAFTVETNAGSGTPTFVFKQDGEKLTGHYSGQLGEADLTGTVKGNAINFTFTGDVQGNKIEATYTGTVETKDSMKGTVKLAGLGEGTFTGKRQ